MVHLEAPNYKPQGYTLDAAVKNTDPSPVKVVFSNVSVIIVFMDFSCCIIFLSIVFYLYFCIAPFFLQL